MHICHICNARHASLTPFSKHLFLHLNLIPYVCFTCLDFLTSRFIKSYVTDNVFFVSEKNSSLPSINESPERASNLCGGCHNFISNYKDFIFHIQEHTQELHQCSTCILSFPSDIQHTDPEKNPVYNCFMCKTTFDGDPRCNIFEPLIFCNLEKLDSCEPDLTVKDKLVFTIQKRSRENSTVANSLISASHCAESFSKGKPSNFSASHCAESSKVVSKGKPSNFCAESRKIVSKGKPSNFCAKSRKIVSKGKPSNFCAESRKIVSKGKPSNFCAESRKIVSKGKPSNFCSYLLANAHLKTNAKSNKTDHKRNHASVKSCDVSHHSKCTKQYGENITIHPPKLNCSGIEARVSFPHNYQIVKQSGSKLVLKKLQDSETGIISMNVNKKDSFGHTINQKHRTSPRYIVPNRYYVRDLNSKTGTELLLIYPSNRDSFGCTTNQKNETTPITPYKTDQLNTYRKNSPIVIYTSPVYTPVSTSRGTTSVSPSMPLSLASLALPLTRSAMSPANSSHNLKGTERLQETTAVNLSMPLSSASSALPLVHPTMSPTNSSHNLKGTESLQETTSVSPSMPLSLASLALPLTRSTMSPANSSHNLKGTERLQETTTVSPSMPLSSASSALPLVHSTMSPSNSSHNLKGTERLQETTAVSRSMPLSSASSALPLVHPTMSPSNSSHNLKGTERLQETTAVSRSMPLSSASSALPLVHLPMSPSNSSHNLKGTERLQETTSVSPSLPLSLASLALPLVHPTMSPANSSHNLKGTERLHETTTVSPSMPLSSASSALPLVHPTMSPSNSSHNLKGTERLQETTTVSLSMPLSSASSALPLVHPTMSPSNSSHNLKGTERLQETTAVSRSMPLSSASSALPLVHPPMSPSNSSHNLKGTERLQETTSVSPSLPLSLASLALPLVHPTMSPANSSHNLKGTKRLQETTTVSPSMLLSSASSALPLVHPTMSPSNSSQNLKGTERLQETTTVSPSMSLSSASSALPLVHPTMSPANSSHNLKGTERLQETTTGSLSMPLSSAFSALPLVHPTMSPSNSSHNLKGTERLQETTTVSPSMPLSSASSALPLGRPTMSTANSSPFLKRLLKDSFFPTYRNPFFDFQTSVNTVSLNASECLPVNHKRKPQKSNEEKVDNLTSVINSLHKLNLLGKDFQESQKQQNSSVHQKSTSAGDSPKISRVFYTSKDSPRRQIKQMKGCQYVWRGCKSCVDVLEQNRNGLCLATEMMESKSFGDDAEQNRSGLWLVKEMMDSKSSGDDAELNRNGSGIVKDCLPSSLNTVEVIPSKEVPAKSVFPENVCSTKNINATVSSTKNMNATVSAYISSSMNYDILRNNETSSRNVLSSHQIENSEKDIITSTDSLLIMNEAEMPGNGALNVLNFERNQCNGFHIDDLQSLKDPDAGCDNSFFQNNSIPVNDVQTQSVEVSRSHGILPSSDGSFLLSTPESMLDKSNAVLYNGFKVGNHVFINYNQSKESVKHLSPFRKFEILNSGGWLSIPIMMPMPTNTEKAPNDTVCLNSLSIQASSCLVPDQNNIAYYNVDLQSASAEDLSKHQNIAMNGLQYLNISASDSFQNSQHSVIFERSKIKNIDDSQSDLNDSKSLNNNENLVISSYANRKSPECNGSFRINTVPIGMSQYNSSGNLKGKISVDDKLKCMNNDLFNISQNPVGLEQSEVTSVDVSQSDLYNSKPLTNENSQNIINLNHMSLEHNDLGNINKEANSDYPKSVGSTESEDCDKSELFECRDVLVESSLVENSKADPVHSSNLRSENYDSKSAERTSIPNSTNNRPSSGIENENWNKLKHMYNLKSLSVHLIRLPSVICQNLYSPKNEKADQVSNNSKKLSVVLTKLPQYVYSYATYKIYEQSREQKSALQRKERLESVDKNIPGQDSNLLSASLENNNSVTDSHINNHNASTSVDVKTVSKKSNFLSQACCSARPTEFPNESHFTDVHIMENAATMENKFVPRDHLNQQSLENPVLSFGHHIKKELDICDQRYAEQMGTPADPIASSSTDMETSCINSDFQSLSSSSVGATELTTKLHTTDPNNTENAATVENNFVPLDHLNQQPLENHVLSFGHHIKKEFDICNQQFVEQIGTKTHPLASTSTDMQTPCINSDFQLLSYCSVGATELTTKLHTTDLNNMENAATVGNNFVPLDHLNQQPLQISVIVSNTCVEQNLDTCNPQSTDQIETPVLMCDNSNCYRNPLSNTSRLHVASTPNSDELGCCHLSVSSTANSNELNSSQVSVPSTSNANKLNSYHQQSAALTENSYCCDDLYTFELLNGKRVPMFAPHSPSSDSSSVEILEDDEIECNLSDRHLPSANDSSCLMSNCRNKLYTDCYEKSLEKMDAFSLWKTEYQLKYLRNRIKYINKTLAKVVENRQNMKFLKLRILLNRLPDSIYEKHLKKKPIMLSSILPTITKVHSLSDEKRYSF